MHVPLRVEGSPSSGQLVGWHLPDCRWWREAGECCLSGQTTEFATICGPLERWYMYVYHKPGMLSVRESIYSTHCICGKDLFLAGIFPAHFLTCNFFLHMYCWKQAPWEAYFPHIWKCRKHFMNVMTTFCKQFSEKVLVVVSRDYIMFTTKIPCFCLYKWIFQNIKRRNHYNWPLRLSQLWLL